MLKKYDFAKFTSNKTYLDEYTEEYKVNNHIVSKTVFIILFSKMNKEYKRSCKYSSLFETDAGYKSTTDLQTYERIEE